MRLLRRLAAITVLVLAALAAGHAASASGLATYSLAVDGTVRTYTVYVPSNYSGRQPVPVVIMLHGAGASGTGVIGETGWDKKAEQHGFLAVFPDALPPDRSAPPSFFANPPLWNDGSGRGSGFQHNIDDVSFVSLLLTDLGKNYVIDPKAVFLTGFSNGASLAFHAAALLPGKITAIAAVAGHYWPPLSPVAHSPVPTLFIAGTADPLNPVNGGTVSLPWGDFPQPALLTTIQLWARDNGCSQGLSHTAGKPGIQIFACRGGRVPLRAYLVEGLGHLWPGGIPIFPEGFIGKDPGTLAATDVIWAFFAEIRAANR